MTGNNSPYHQVVVTRRGLWVGIALSKSEECFLPITELEVKKVNDQPQLSYEPCTETTHLSSINIQGHVEATVSSHQVSPGIGPVPLVAVDSGGFHGSVCAEREVEPRIFGAGRFHSSDAHRPALLTHWMWTVVKYTYGRGEMVKSQLYYFGRVTVGKTCKYSLAKSKVSTFT